LCGKDELESLFLFTIAAVDSCSVEHVVLRMRREEWRFQKLKNKKPISCRRRSYQDLHVWTFGPERGEFCAARISLFFSVNSHLAFNQR
jgi:hypothetical protein